jgi:hypothetical protein
MRRHPLEHIALRLPVNLQPQARSPMVSFISSLHGKENAIPPRPAGT